jgi:hypothetical protein
VGVTGGGCGRQLKTKHTLKRIPSVHHSMFTYNARTHAPYYTASKLPSPTPETALTEYFRLSSNYRAYHRVTDTATKAGGIYTEIYHQIEGSYILLLFRAL